MKTHNSAESKGSSQDGFTIIELTLALVFISFILIFVVVATVQVMRSYNKGLVTKQMNQAGRTITEELKRVASNSSASELHDLSNVGRLCVGRVSFVWNEPDITGYTTFPHNRNMFQPDSGVSQPVDIVRIDDSQGDFCKNSGSAIPLPKNDDRVSVLSNGSVRLLNFKTEHSDDNQILGISFMVASVGANKPVLNGTNFQCPTDGPNLFGTFCAVADFETSIFLRNENGS